MVNPTSRSTNFEIPLFLFLGFYSSTSDVFFFSEGLSIDIFPVWFKHAKSQIKSATKPMKTRVQQRVLCSSNECAFNYSHLSHTGGGAAAVRRRRVSEYSIFI